MGIFYNDFDKNSTAWLSELISAGQLEKGSVDGRSISEILPGDLDGFRQAHFFAGIGGWPLALRLAGWPDEWEVWTGSCPCQPFSCAVKQKGVCDERHLWPEFLRLISECRPPVVFGEQVASRLGREWLAGVCSDLEALGYAVGAADLCAAGVGAPHIRQRLFWGAARLADMQGDYRRSGEFGTQEGLGPNEEWRVGSSSSGAFGGLGLTPSDGREQRRAEPGRSESASEASGGVGDGERTRLEGWSGESGDDGPEQQAAERAGGWVDSRTILCRDGKWRRIPQYVTTKPIFQLLANGLSGTMDSGWLGYVHKAKERIVSYAEKARIGPREVLREVWGFVGKEEIQRRLGRQGGVYATEVLLVALCQLEGELGEIVDCEVSSFNEEENASVREVRDGSSRFETTSRPSQERRHHGQQGEELGNLVRELSQIGASQKEALKMIHAAGGFPLSESLPGRVAQLRGLGNAIVPQVAATFVRAFMEAIWQKD